MADHPAPAAAPEAAKKKSMSKVKIGAIVGAIVLVQCVLAYLYLPGGESSAKADAKKDAAPAHGAKGDKDKDSAVAGDSRSEQREVDLGKFSLTTFDANSNTTMLIDFHLYGAVAVEHEDKDAKADPNHGEKGHAGKPGEGGDEDNSYFGRLFRKNKNRFRDQVIVILRNAQMSDLADPSLGLIKRQILAKTNSLFGEPVLKDVLFSDFAVVQQ
jgi:flagellar basal body-associated protein FliL